MKAIILAAGYATRLYPLTLDKPKPLLEIKGKPLMNYIINNLEKTGVDEIYIVTNDRFYLQFVWWLNKNKFSKKIELINDETNSNETRLGGVGDLSFALKQKSIDDDVLVILGDNLFDFDLRELTAQFNKSNKTTLGVYDIHSLEDAKRFGIIGVSGDKIVSFTEKPEKPESSLISTGIYLFSKSDIGMIDEYITSGGKKDAPGFFVEYLIPKTDVQALTFEGRWFDIGSIDVYNRVNREW
jgi:glucose-1-phosphate thymidylyltransferase